MRWLEGLSQARQLPGLPARDPQEDGAAVNPAIALGVFLLAIVYDFAYAAYVKATTVGRPARAAFFSACVYLVGVVGVVAVVRVSLWYVIPEAFGMAVGTWFGVYFNRDVD